jgi:hypothetical protein
MSKSLQFYKIKFGYTQVLFMGSVPRINCLLAIVPYLVNSLLYSYTNKNYLLITNNYINNNNIIKSKQ